MQTARHKPDKGFKGIGMEGRIATWYAKNTARDMAEFRALAERLASPLAEGARVLEVAPGPGYLAVELAKRGRFSVTGLDVSHTFVQIGSENAKRAGVDVEFRQGNASALPFESKSFDLVVCRAAFKNFSRPLEAIDEMQRVLKVGGRAVIVDLSKNASIGDIDAYIAGAGLSWMNELIYKATFRYLLLPRAYSREQFEELAARSRFKSAEIAESGIGLEITLRRTA